MVRPTARHSVSPHALTCVLKQGRASKTALKDSDRGHNHPRSDLGQRRLTCRIPFLLLLLRCLATLCLDVCGSDGRRTGIVLDDLVVAEPDLAVADAEREDVVDKRLGTARAAWDAKDLWEGKERVGVRNALF